MVILDIVVDGQKKTMYIDGCLNNQLDSKVIPNVKKKDNDGVYIVDGGEGAGKSVLAMQLAKKTDPTFTLDRICFTPDEFTKAILKARKGQAVVFDEAFTGLSSRGSLTEVNRLLVSLMMEMRQKNLFVIIVMPTFFLLDKYVAIWRARGLFHVYTKRGKRGFWMFFNKNSKKLLYLLGKKLYDYSKPRSNFKGKFYEQYTIDEEEYRAKKSGSMTKKSRITKAIKYYNQRNVLFWILYEKLKINQSKIVKLCKEMDFKIDRTSISKIIIEKKKEILAEEILLEEEARENEIEQENEPKIAQKQPFLGDVPRK